MAEEENTEGSEGAASAKKFDPQKVKEALQNLDWKDKKIQGIAAGVVVVSLILVFLMFSGEAEVEKPSTTVELMDLQRPVDYVLVYGADPKETELRATIKDDDRVMQFSMSLGIEEKGLRLEVQKRMAPIVSETLRFFSRMTREEILEMIQDEDGKTKEKLLVRMNLVLKNAGEEKLDLQKAGRIVQINFLKYYFPTI